MQGHARLTVGGIHNPVRGLLHGSAALISMTFAVYLWSQTACPPACRLAFLVCALGQFGLYLTSCLYHTIPWEPVSKKRMQRLDHSMIYLGIAGTLTPVVWLGLDGRERELILGAAWSIALLGCAQKLLLPRIREKASIPFQILEACLVLPALSPFAERFPGAPLQLVAFGAACYAVGALCFIAQRPRLWPRVFSFHEIFHVCTLFGSGSYYLLIAQYLSRAG